MEIKNKTILITGANGLVGLPTVEKCLARGASRVIAVDIKTDNLKTIADPRLRIVEADLTYLDICENLFQDVKVDIVLHLAGIKGSPARAKLSPADYLFPMLMFNTNVIKSAFDAKVDWFVYMSSVGVYYPSDVMVEDSVWSTMPSVNDWYPGWTKRMGELSLEALGIQHSWTNWSIIRPANIYGLYDNFSPDATVIGSNIWKLFNVPGNDITCWGDGSAKRDFVFSEDVAESALQVVEKQVNDVINFGSATATSIKDTIETLVAQYEKLTGQTKNIVWDTTKPNGDLIRRLDPDKQIKYGILPQTNLESGIYKTLNHYIKNSTS
jgi:GDP-L-fucose synthase